MPKRSCQVTPRRLPADPRAGRAHLSAVDPALAPWIERIGRLQLRRHDEGLRPLCRQIIGQQLSMRVAGVIARRFFDLAQVPTDAELPPERLLALTAEQLRAAGLSAAKAATMHALAEFWAAERLDAARLRQLPDEELIALLTRVRGIGPWTVKMYLMFSLHRPDVLPQEDLGLRAGLAAVDGLPRYPSPKETIARTAAWTPWRSLGTHYCWEVLRVLEAEKRPG